MSNTNHTKRDDKEGGEYAGAPEAKTVPSPLVAPILLLLSKIRWCFLEDIDIYTVTDNQVIMVTVYMYLSKG